MLDLFFVFLIGVLGGFVGSVAAGSDLITVPGLLLLGVPPQIALATARFGALGFKFGSLVKYLKHKIYIKDLIIPMSLMGIIGSAFGARLLIEIDEDLLSKIIGVVLVVLLPVLFLRKDVGLVHRK